MTIKVRNALKVTVTYVKVTVSKKEEPCWCLLRPTVTKPGIWDAFIKIRVKIAFAGARTCQGYKNIFFQ